MKATIVSQANKLLASVEDEIDVLTEKLDNAQESESPSAAERVDSYQMQIDALEDVREALENMLAID